MTSIRIDERTIHGNLCRIIEHASTIIFVLVNEMGCGMYLCVTNKIYFGLAFSGVVFLFVEYRFVSVNLGNIDCVTKLLFLARE